MIFKKSFYCTVLLFELLLFYVLFSNWLFDFLFDLCQVHWCMAQWLHNLVYVVWEILPPVKWDSSIEYRSDDVTKNFFCISAFWIPCLGGAWWKTSTAQIWWESVHGGPRYGCMNTYIVLSPIEISVNWPGSKQLWTRPIYTDFNVAN